MRLLSAAYAVWSTAGFSLPVQVHKAERKVPGDVVQPRESISSVRYNNSWDHHHITGLEMYAALIRYPAVRL